MDTLRSLHDEMRGDKLPCDAAPPPPVLLLPQADKLHFSSAAFSLSTEYFGHKSWPVRFKSPSPAWECCDGCLWHGINKMPV